MLDDGILGASNELTWDVEAFAVATGYDEKTRWYLGLAIPHQDVFGQVTDQTLLVRPDLALAQRELEMAEREAEAQRRRGSGEEPAGLPGSAAVKPEWVDGEPSAGADGGEAAPGPKNVRFFGVAQINPERYARDLTRLSQEIIQHLAAPDGVELEVRVEISARKPGGYPDDKVRTVTENARTLKLETYGFEDR